jgi:hypothetical protein
MATRKKKSTTARKAKRSPARPRRRGQLALPLGSPQTWPRVDRDLTGRGIVVGKPETFPPGLAMDASGWPAFNLVMRKPHPRAARAIEREMKAAAEAKGRREAYTAKMNSRPKEMQGADYTLPDDVRLFLRKRYPAAIEHDAEWQMMKAVGWPDDSRVHVALHDVLADAIHAAYMAGCTEGYIEGVVMRMAPDRKRSATANYGKRKVPVAVGKVTMTRDERDALMADEFAKLVTIMKPTPAYQRLAGKYGYESWQGVAAAIKAFRKRRPQ